MCMGIERYRFELMDICKNPNPKKRKLINIYKKLKSSNDKILNVGLDDFYNFLALLNVYRKRF